MPKQISMTVYSTSELTGRAKEKALDWARQVYDFDSECLTEFFQEKLKEAGLPYNKVRWSLSSCQGDGVAFYGTIDIDAWNEKQDVKIPKEWPNGSEVEIKIAPNHFATHYSHANTMDIQGCENEDLESEIRQVVRSMSNELERLGYADINAHDAEENMVQILTDAEVYFDASGKKVANTN